MNASPMVVEKARGGKKKELKAWKRFMPAGKQQAAGVEPCPSHSEGHANKDEWHRYAQSTAAKADLLFKYSNPEAVLNCTISGIFCFWQMRLSLPERNRDAWLARASPHSSQGHTRK